MLKKFLFFGVTVVLVVAMLLSACTGTEEETPTGGTTVEGEVTTPGGGTTTPGGGGTVTPPTTDEPQYGGTISFVFGHYKANDYFDPIISAVGGWVNSITYDKLISADWAKGPQGTKENPFTGSHIPTKWRAGNLTESWEVVSLTEMVFHVRHGVYFQDKLPARGREMNAQDVVYTFQRGQQDPRFTAYGSYDWNDPARVKAWRDLAKQAGRSDADMDAWIAELKSINYPFLASSYMIANDNWTIKYKLFTAYSGIVDIGSWLFVLPKESTTYDMNDWKNACGTGAWIVQDSVSGGSVTWRRNDNYWMSDPLHPNNKLPYADFLRGIIIIDEATQLAAIRTHKVDMLGVAWDKVDGLKKSNPELISKVMSPTGANVIFMRTDIEPYNNVKVRQALSMGIDRQAIINDYFKGNAIIDAWPVLPSNLAGYTPYAQMPAEVKKLFEYHPDEAKKLLAEAGFPTMKAEVVIYQAPVDQDQLQLVVEQWKTIGVDATIKVVEGATHTSLIYGGTYPSMIYSYWGNGSPQSCWGWAHGGVANSIYNFSKVIDQEAVTVFQQWSAITDEEEASKIMKAEYLRQDALVWEVPLATQVGSRFWAPYIKGYAGELNMGLTGEMGTDELFKFWWIDPTIYKEVTGKTVK
jgi:ABC-type transport system substrate-binding protein